MPELEVGELRRTIEGKGGSAEYTALASTGSAAANLYTALTSAMASNVLLSAGYKSR